MPETRSHTLRPLIGTDLLVLLGSLIIAFTLASPRQATNPAPVQAVFTLVADHKTQAGTAGKSNYYISPQGHDTNDGSQHRPWATISHAGAMAAPGATIHVAPGIYRETVVTLASGTPTARIRYVSDKKWAAVIDPLAHTTFAWKHLGNYSDIVGFEVAGTDCDGIALGGSFQGAYSNNVHNSAKGCNDSNGGSGIDDFNYSSRDNDIIGNYVHDVGIDDPLCGERGHGFIHGIYQSNYGGHIRLNLSVNNCGWGIHLWHAATHAVITNNTVVKNRSGGIVIGSGDSPCSTTGCPGGNDFTIVRNNIVAFNGNPAMGGWGIREEPQEPGQVGPHNQYSHNLSFQNVTGDFLLLHQLQCTNCIRGQDPLFVSISLGDYQIRKGSPAAGAGLAKDVPPMDSWGNMAPPNSRQDIGAFAEADVQRNR